MNLNRKTGDIMSRTQIVLDSKNNEQSSKIIEEILDSHKFDFVSKNGEEYWQQGIGVSQSPKYIRYYFDEDKVILEGWITNLGKESDLNGVFAAVPKKSCKKVLNEISEAIEKSNSEEIIDSPKTEEPEEEVLCQSCGTKSPAGAKFCEGCGSPLADQKDDSINAPAENKEKTAEKENQISKSNVASESNNTSTSSPRTSKGIIPRRYRGSIISNIIEILIAIFYIIGASAGQLVLRFTDSSEALMIVAVIILIHGVLSLISNLQDS